MACINLGRSWLYFFEPHTASRATKDFLMTIGGADFGHHHISYEDLTNPRRQHISKGRASYLKRLVTVRNPLDVLVTKWSFSGQKDTPFCDWVLGNKEDPRIAEPLLGLWKDATIFCYYEQLNGDLAWMFSVSDKNFELSKDEKHVTPFKEPWWTYYDGNYALLDFVLKQYGTFMNTFGYQFEYLSGIPQMFVDTEIHNQKCRKV